MGLSFINIEEKAAAGNAGEISEERSAKAEEGRGAGSDIPYGEGRGKSQGVKGNVGKRRGRLVV